MSFCHFFKFSQTPNFTIFSFSMKYFFSKTFPLSFFASVCLCLRLCLPLSLSLSVSLSLFRYPFPSFGNSLQCVTSTFCSQKETSSLSSQIFGDFLILKHPIDFALSLSSQTVSGWIHFPFLIWLTALLSLSANHWSPTHHFKVPSYSCLAELCSILLRLFTSSTFLMPYSQRSLWERLFCPATHLLLSSPSPSGKLLSSGKISICPATLSQLHC